MKTTDYSSLRYLSGLLLVALGVSTQPAKAKASSKNSIQTVPGIILANAPQLPQCVTDVTTYYSSPGSALHLFLKHPAGIRIAVRDTYGGKTAELAEAASADQREPQKPTGPYFSRSAEGPNGSSIDIHLGSGGAHELAIRSAAGQVAPVELAVWVGESLPCLAAATDDRAQARPAPFSDVANYRWAEAAIGLLTARGVLAPAAGNEFGPAQEVSRAEFAEALEGFFGLKPPRAPMPVADVDPASSSYGAIVAVVPYLGYHREAGRQNAFGPQQTVTRQEGLAAVAKLLVSSGMTKPLDSTQVQTVLDKRREVGAAPAEARASLAIGFKLGFLRGWPATSLRLQGGLTRAELAVLLLNVDFVFHFSDSHCARRSAAGKGTTMLRIHLPAELLARPTWQEICTIRNALALGAAVTAAGNGADQISALLGRRLPVAAVSLAQPGTRQAQKKALRIARRFAPLPSTPPTLAISGVYLGRTGIPHVYEGFTSDPARAKALNMAGLQRWLTKANTGSRIAVNGPGPTPRDSVENQGEPGDCGIVMVGPNAGPGGSTAGNTWFCYIELNAEYSDNTWGSYSLNADVLRQDENDPNLDRYVFAAQWDSNPQFSDNFVCNNSSAMLFGNSVCMAYVSGRAVSMTNQTADTNPGLFGWPPNASVTPPNPSSLPTVPMKLPSSSMFHGPPSSTGSVSNTVGGGLSAGIGYNGTVSVSTTVSESFNQSWSHPDILITDDSVTGSNPGAANFPPNTGSWVEVFHGASIYPFYWDAPAKDATGGFNGTNEIAVFEVDEQSQAEPFQASVFGTLQVGTASAFYVFGIPFGGVDAGIPLVNMQLTFALSPPTFYACSGSELVDILTLGFANVPVSCSYPGSGTQELDVPAGIAGVAPLVLMYGKESEYGAPVAWTPVNQQNSSFEANPLINLGLGTTPANCLITAILCGMQVSLVNPSAAGGTQGLVVVATNPPFVSDNAVLPYNAYAMTITSISPQNGPAAGGTPVTIQGVGFSDLYAVRFGNNAVFSCQSAPAPCFRVNGQNTQITVTTPPGSAGSVPVTVENLFEAISSPAAAAVQFAYQ